MLPPWGDARWSGDVFAAREAGLTNLASANPFLMVVCPVWFCAEVIVMRINKRRRALHDLIAGTVAIVRRPARGLGYALDPQPGDPGA